MTQHPLGSCACPGPCPVHDRDAADGRDLTGIGCDEVTSLTGEVRPQT